MKILLILTLSIIVLTFASCGVNQADYDKVVAEKMIADFRITNLKETTVSQNATIQDLQEQLSQAKPPTYFENRTAIENWLKTVKNLGVSKDPEQWLQFALYYQKKAIESGHIISVSYIISEDEDINVTCDIITEDGWIYFFNPDKLELKDTRIRVDMVDAKELEATATGVYQ